MVYQHFKDTWASDTIALLDQIAISHLQGEEEHVARYECNENEGVLAVHSYTFELEPFSLLEVLGKHKALLRFADPVRFASVVSRQRTDRSPFLSNPSSEDRESSTGKDSVVKGDKDLRSPHVQDVPAFKAGSRVRDAYDPTNKVTGQSRRGKSSQRRRLLKPLRTVSRSYKKSIFFEHLSPIKSPLHKGLRALATSDHDVQKTYRTFEQFLEPQMLYRRPSTAQKRSICKRVVNGLTSLCPSTKSGESLKQVKGKKKDEKEKCTFVKCCSRKRWIG